MARSAAVRTILEGFLARLDDVVERSADAIWEVVPSYERSGEPLRQDVRQSVRENVETLAKVLSAGRAIRSEELEPIERAGARRAEAGIPLDDVLHAYRTVSRVCWDVLADECRRYEGDALEPAIELAEAVLAYTDGISTAVAEAYARAQRAIVREQEGARREFLADVLYGTDAAPEEVLARAHSFGYDLSLSYVALVGCGPQDDGRKEAAVLAAAAAVASSGNADPIVLQKAEQTIALLPADPGPDPGVAPYKLVAELGGGWRFGVGGPEPGLEGIRRAYLEAREALEVGMALGLPEQVYLFDDLLLYHFLRSEPPLVERFVDQMLGPLVDYDNKRKGELVKTLEAYFAADASVKLAGEALFAHPHTVTYRLKQIEKLTGWSLREPEDKLRLQLALRAHRLSTARTDPPANLT
ncbi:MAG TPA: helix-turn-helix domain-containing protein [Actinomycetota bacterium]|nr:helix-turn-helix domain-containing protein [Actinomycetota bacterium]